MHFVIDCKSFYWFRSFKFSLQQLISIERILFLIKIWYTWEKIKLWKESLKRCYLSRLIQLPKSSHTSSSLHEFRSIIFQPLKNNRKTKLVWCSIIYNYGIHLKLREVMKWIFPSANDKLSSRALDDLFEPPGLWLTVSFVSFLPFVSRRLSGFLRF